jgi:hypothetical protein
MRFRALHLRSITIRIAPFSAESWTVSDSRLLLANTVPRWRPRSKSSELAALDVRKDQTAVYFIRVERARCHRFRAVDQKDLQVIARSDGTR